jgi:hypothetical protein
VIQGGGYLRGLVRDVDAVELDRQDGQAQRLLVTGEAAGMLGQHAR